MRRVLVKAIIAVFYWTGILRICRFLHRNEIAILAIHGVMDDQDGSVWRPMREQLSRRKLDEYLQALSKRYRFVSLSNAVDMLQGRRVLEPYSMVLTFDDGYRNNLTHALPILRRYNAPATFFIPTGYVENPTPFWCDRLDYALQQVPVDGREVTVGPLTMCLDGQDREALCESYTRFRRAAKKLHMPDHVFVRDMEQLAAQLEAESGLTLSDIQQDDDWSAIMTWDRIQQVDDSITIGSHTVDHVRLGLVAEDVARDQLIRSKQAIEGQTGKICHSICFPSGSFKNETILLVRESGYACAVTTIEGLNRLGDNVLTLRRIGLPLNANWKEVLFRLSVSCS